MADISKHIATNNIPTRIFEWYESQAEGPRRHLGASLIGRECERMLWYTFRHFGGASFPGRVLRLFGTGQWAEERIVQELREIGLRVEDRAKDGNQFRFSDVGGHFGGSMDLIAKGLMESPDTWHVGEIKTANDRIFKQIQKHGIKKEKPEYYAQAMVYMHLSGLKRAFFLVVNKNTDDIYYERIKYKKKDAVALIERARRVIKAQAPPDRIADSPKAFACKWCNYAGLCHPQLPGRPVMDGYTVSCRNCLHATPETKGDEGRWFCEKKKLYLSDKAQAEACDEHRIIPYAVPGWTAVDADPDGKWVRYQNDEDPGAEFVNGEGGYTSYWLGRAP